MSIRASRRLSLTRAASRSRAPARALSPESLLLGLLSQEPAHGYELQRRLASELPALWNLRESQLYATLKRLEARGLITGRGSQGAGRAARRRFRLTAAGSRLFEGWLLTPTPASVRAIRVEFLSRLHFALQRDRTLARRLLDEQADAILHAIDRLETGLEALPIERPLSRLAAKLRIQQLRSTIDWLAECGATLGLEEEHTAR